MYCYQRCTCIFTKELGVNLLEESVTESDRLGSGDGDVVGIGEGFAKGIIVGLSDGDAIGIGEDFAEGSILG